MKFLDRYIRDWRIRVASNYIRPNDKVLDIGCFDGYLFKSLASKPIAASIGLDPLLKQIEYIDNHKLLPGNFPENLPKNTRVDSIVLLAVLEHIPREDQLQLNTNSLEFLKSKGRVIITVPSPLVDHILYILKKLRLVDGMSLDQHYGFKAKEVPELFDANKFKLLKYKKFQFGLNNLFVFEKTS